MRYQGGKSRIARKIVAEIRKLYPQVEDIWEPFCGGGAVTKALAEAGFRVHASDSHPDLIMMWWAMCAGQSQVFAAYSPSVTSRLRNAPPSARRGFVGFGSSRGGEWFTGYPFYHDVFWCWIARRAGPTFISELSRDGCDDIADRGLGDLRIVWRKEHLSQNASNSPTSKHRGAITREERLYYLPPKAERSE